MLLKALLNFFQSQKKRKGKGGGGTPVFQVKPLRVGYVWPVWISWDLCGPLIVSESQ